MNFKTIVLMGVVGALGLTVLSGCVDRESQKDAKLTQAFASNPTVSVTATPVHMAPISESVDITGEITTSQDVAVGAKSAGRVVAVYVKDGDVVKAGQVLAQQDTVQLQAQVSQAMATLQQAQAGLLNSQSQLAQAIQNLAINPQKSSAAVSSASSQLRAAKANLQKTLDGARPQERLQAQANVASAQSNFKTQQLELARVKALVAEGAIAANRLDQQQATYDSAKTALENAQQSLKLIQIGNRDEDIQAAREQVHQAEEALKTSKSNKQLDRLYLDQVNGAKAQVASAKAQIESAKAQVTIAQQAIKDATIVAPFSGHVSGKPVEVGTMAGSGNTIVTIVGGNGTYFEAQVPSEKIAKIQSGLSVKVAVSGLAGGPINGRVAAINPLGDTVGRLFKVRVQFDSSPVGLRPGMFATGTIVTRTVPQALVVPSASIVTRDGKQVVFVVENGKAKLVPVTVGLVQGDWSQIVSGVSSGDSVVSEGQATLVEGAPLKVVQKSTGSAKSATEKG